MAKINIVGLGPGDINSLTLEAVRKIEDSNKNYLRTKHHPTVEYLNSRSIEYISFDNYYEEAKDFKQVYSKIVEKLIKEAKKNSEINYFVPGNPMIAEKTVEKLLNYKDEVEINIISGMSFIEPLIELVEVDPIGGLKIIDGADFYWNLIDINTNIIITQSYNRRILSDIKLVISEIYGDEYEIFVINSAGIKNREKVEKIPIYKLDRIDLVDHLTSIFIPKVDKKTYKLFDFNDLEGIIELLLGDNGCPWDSKQTHQTLKKNIIEESYELVDAIDNEDIDNMIEELGDVLLQVLFHAQIGLREGSFNMYDITSELGNKLIRRHPHVFSKKNLVKTDEVLYNWDTVKNEERNLITVKDKFSDITSNLPSLEKSYKIQDIASKLGFDWTSIDGPIEKLNEEIQELREAIESKDENHIEDELGDVLFTVVNISRFLNISPDLALIRANKKFKSRFIVLENIAREKGLNLEELNLDELDNLWEMSKRKQN